MGGYEDWLRQRRSPAPALTSGKKQSAITKTTASKSKTPSQAQKPKLSYKEQRELDELPERIEALEKEQADLQHAMGQPDSYKQDKQTVAATLARLEQIGSELLTCYERWEKLM